jgi:hypothetical protein
MRGIIVQAFLALLVLQSPIFIANVYSAPAQSVIAGYSTKQAVLINYTSGPKTLTDYQVRLKLDATNFSFNETMDNGEDIRFTDEDGVTPLDYWVETWNRTEQLAIIWIKVPSISSSQEKTIYFYYGKPGDSSVSSGEATFVFFDDFSQGLSWWVPNTGVSIEGNVLKLQGYTYTTSKAILPSGDYAIFAKTWGQGGFVVCYVNANTGDGFGFSKETVGRFSSYMLSTSGLKWIGSVGGGQVDKNTPYILENGRYGNLSVNYGLAMEPDYSLLGMTSSYNFSVSKFIIQLRTLRFDDLHYVEYVAVRKYNYFENEPSVKFGERTAGTVVPNLITEIAALSSNVLIYLFGAAIIIGAATFAVLTMIHEAGRHSVDKKESAKAETPPGSRKSTQL